MLAVEVRDLHVRYGDTKAVDGTSWSAQTGEVVALLGPNGAGKTTTIETLEGYRSPTSGSVTVLGLDPIVDARSLAPRIGVMLQRNGVYLTMSPLDMVALFAAYYGDRARRPSDIVEQVGLTAVAKTPWRRLSGGEQQRLSLALALVGRPEVAFLDEPTAMVDPSARQRVREIIADLRADGTCVIVTTHDLDDVERMADRVVMLHQGRVVADGALRDLTAGTDQIIFEAASIVDETALSASLAARVSRNSVGAYVVDLSPIPANVARVSTALAAHAIAVDGIRAGRHRLEDVFALLTANTDSDEPANRKRRRR